MEIIDNIVREKKKKGGGGEDDGDVGEDGYENKICADVFMYFYYCWMVISKQ